MSSFPSTTFSEELGLGGTEAFYVLVVDTISQSPQLLTVLLSSIFFGFNTGEGGSGIEQRHWTLEGWEDGKGWKDWKDWKRPMAMVG